MRNDSDAALRDTLQALHILGVDLDPAPTLETANTMFEQVKNEILAVGFDAILAIPRTSEPRTDLAVTLLGDAGTHAYWSTGEGFTDVIGLTVRFMSQSHHVLTLCVPIRPFNCLCGKCRLFRRDSFRLFSVGQLWNVPWYGTRILLGTDGCAS